MKKQGKVVVNITKKSQTKIDRFGNVLEEKSSGKDALKDAQEKRAKKLGLK